jgi:hypothetical protein
MGAQKVEGYPLYMFTAQIRSGQIYRINTADEMYALVTEIAFLGGNTGNTDIFILRQRQP